MKTTKEIVTDKALVAYCGLYCGACRSYLTDRCPGCRDNVKASWCKIRQCCQENSYSSCADCKLVDLKECKKYNNFISKIFGYVFNSDRAACIVAIKEKGYDAFAADMVQSGRPSISRKR
jgi:hypothetical protein